MRKFIGPLTRVVFFTLALIIQVGFIQSLSLTPRPWINLPLVLLLWTAVHRMQVWPLVAAGAVGAIIDLTTPHAFGVFVAAHVLATLAVMIISVEWLNRRGTGNRVVIACAGLLLYGLTWWIADRHLPFAPHFWSWDILWEILLLWLGFSSLKMIRPLWVGLTKPIKRYA